MRRSRPLAPGSLILFYPLVETMSHSYRECGGGERKDEARQVMMGFTGVQGFEGVNGEKKKTHSSESQSWGPARENTSLSAPVYCRNITCILLQPIKCMMTINYPFNVVFIDSDTKALISITSHRCQFHQPFLASTLLDRVFVRFTRLLFFPHCGTVAL